MLELENESDPRSAAARVSQLTLRKPTEDDAAAVSSLVEDCPPLDRNSRYCNLLQCTDFADTCILAENGGEPVGWVSAYRPPKKPATLFIWQVAVHPEARGRGLGNKMILSLLQRRACAGVRSMRTTITPDNEASRALFRSIASTLRAPMAEQPYFDRDRHFLGHHASEHLITIGPISRRNKNGD